MKWAWIALATVAVIAGLWAVGEFHRQNCIRDGNVGCTIWPWNSGTPNSGFGYFPK